MVVERLSGMKYALIVVDGLSDRPTEQLDSRTPLAAAVKPLIQTLAVKSEIGITKLSDSMTEPHPVKSNMVLLGYLPPEEYRSCVSLEALASGIVPGQKDVLFRCSPVNLSPAEEYSSRVMLRNHLADLSEDEIHSLTVLLNQEIGNEWFQFVCNDQQVFMIWKQGEPEPGVLLPPEKASGNPIGAFLPKGDFTPVLVHIMEQSERILRSHPLNVARQQGGKAPISSIWLWGEGTIPVIPSFKETFGLDAIMVTDDRATAGLGLTAQMEVKLTDNIAKAAVQAIRGKKPLVYIHTAAIGKISLAGDIEAKTAAIEALDRELVVPVTSALSETGEPFRLIIVSSIAAPCGLKTVMAEPVPYLLYRSDHEIQQERQQFDETGAFSAGRYIPYGDSLIRRMLLNENEEY